ncbi:MAG: glycosyltransferase family 2 protein [Candidatus Kapaibacterium sp.]
MLKNKTVAVVVPAYNEETQIGRVIETMPDFVDRIVIVNDCSKDRTAEIVRNYINSELNHTDLEIKIEKVEKGFYNHAEIVEQQINTDEMRFYTPSEVFNAKGNKDRIILINNLQNSGVGGSIARGYKWCKDNRIDCTAVMAGDAQMDPSELDAICKPVIENGIDYVKGNRLIHRSAWLVVPKIRYFGNSILSILTKVASGYWKISDTQTGYTSISLAALKAIRIHKIYRNYGMPNDILVKLNIAMCSIKEIEIKPVYDVGEKSKIKLVKVIPKISFLLFRSFFKRLWIKYLFRDFHPLFILYHFAIFLFIVWLPYLYKISIKISEGANVSFETLFAFTFLGITSFQSFLFAMWMDIQDNERLYK